MTESCSNCNRQKNLYCPVKRETVKYSGWCNCYDKMPFEDLFKKVAGHNADDFLKGFKRC